MMQMLPAPARRRRAKPDLPHGRAFCTAPRFKDQCVRSQLQSPRRCSIRPPEVGLDPSTPTEGYLS